MVPLTVASKGVFYSNVIRDQSTASYLAQEAIEFIRHERDAQGLSLGGTWDAFLAQFADCFSSEGCIVDPTHPVPDKRIGACAGACPVVRISSTTTPIAYGHMLTWAQTPFTRTVFMNAIGTTEAKVSVVMSWATNGTSRTFEVTTYLLSWQK